MGLYDMVMVKDNHLLAESHLDALQAAISRARAARPGLRIELEADTLAQVKSFPALEGVDVILLDNMTTRRNCARPSRSGATRRAACSSRPAAA